MVSPKDIAAGSDTDSLCGSNSSDEPYSISLTMSSSLPPRQFLPFEAVSCEYAPMSGRRSYVEGNMGRTVMSRSLITRRDRLRGRQGWQTWSWA
jgi:hypothetical protein